MNDRPTNPESDDVHVGGDTPIKEGKLLPDTSEVRSRFAFHLLSEDAAARSIELRHRFADLAAEIVTSTKPSREQSSALTNLELACMWTIKALSRHGARKIHLDVDLDDVFDRSLIPNQSVVDVVAYELGCLRQQAGTQTMVQNIDRAREKIEAAIRHGATRPGTPLLHELTDEQWNALWHPQQANNKLREWGFKHGLLRADRQEDDFFHWDRTSAGEAYLAKAHELASQLTKDRLVGLQFSAQHKDAPIFHMGTGASMVSMAGPLQRAVLRANEIQEIANGSHD